MRPWILVCLCCLGLLGGGACSARPLLDITLKSMSGLSTKGYPRINVTRDGGKTPVREVDKTDGSDPTAVFVIDSDTPVTLGVYLPSGTEGKVEVSAEIVAAAGPCDLTCDPQTVTVHGGDVTSVALMLTGSKTDCAVTRTDGGTDADAEKTDAATDGDASAPTVSDCLSYCDLYLQRCPNNADAPGEYCVGECKAAHWQIGGPDDVAGEDTLSCRVRHLRAAADATLDCSECSAGSPASPGVCGSPPDAGARDACPMSP
jgi:hypothetical protein